MGWWVWDLKGFGRFGRGLACWVEDAGFSKYIGTGRCVRPATVGFAALHGGTTKSPFLFSFWHLRPLVTQSSISDAPILPRKPHSSCSQSLRRCPAATCSYGHIRGRCYDKGAGTLAHKTRRR